MPRPERLRVDVRRFVDMEHGDAVGFAEEAVRGEDGARLNPSATQRSGMIVQSLVLSRAKFSPGEAERWVRAHGFKAAHRGKGPDATGASHRFRQRDPGEFEKGSFRTIRMADGVQAVVGRLRK